MFEYKYNTIQYETIQYNSILILIQIKIRLKT